MLVTHLLITVDQTSAPETWIMTSAAKVTVPRYTKVHGGSIAVIDPTWTVSTYVVSTHDTFMEWSGSTGKEVNIL